jgi:hypothetical protein
MIPKRSRLLTGRILDGWIVARKKSSMSSSQTRRSTRTSPLPSPVGRQVQPS